MEDIKTPVTFALLLLLPPPFHTYPSITGLTLSSDSHRERGHSSVYLVEEVNPCH